MAVSAEDGGGGRGGENEGEESASGGDGGDGPQNRGLPDGVHRRTVAAVFAAYRSRLQETIQTGRRWAVLIAVVVVMG